MSPTIGLIAGLGRLPELFAASVKDRGERVIVIRGLEGAFPDGAPVAPDALYDVFFGRWNEVVDTLKREGAQKVYMVGKIARDLLFRSGAFDDRFRRVVAAGDARNDDALTVRFVEDLEGEGMRVGRQTDYLSHLTCPRGVLTSRRPSDREWDDIAAGYRLARAVGDMDIGQTVVVKAGAVLAVEAVEGTDRAIARGAELGRGGAVAVKVAKPGQDLRFDVPTVGRETIETLQRHGGSVLAFDADETLIVDRERVVAFADAHDLCVVSYAPGMEMGDRS